MAIGTMAAIGIGSAVLGAGASAISSRNNSRAINRATDAQTASTAEQLALQRDIYGQNRATLAPFVQRGNVAGNALNDILGLSAPANNNQPAPQTNALYNGGYGEAAQYYGAGGNPFGEGRMGGLDVNPRIRGAMNLPGPVGGFAGGTYNLDGTQATLPQQGGMPSQVNGNDAFRQYIANSDYAFNFGEGSNAVNSGYAGAGTLQSGAAMKALEDYRQNLQSGYRNEFMGYLGQQQGTGLQAAGAQSGVGINYANAAGNISQNQANALANAAVARANNSNALIGGISSGIGGILGGLGR